MMQYKNTIEFIYANLNEIQENVAAMGADNQIHHIDIDLALSKLRSTYDLLLNLKKEIPEGGDISSKIGKSGQEQNMDDELPLELHNQIIEKPANELADSIRKEMAVNRKETETNLKVSEKGTDTTLSDKFAGEQQALHEEFPKKEDAGDLAAKLKSKPISSITSAIGINEKFELINNLFSGDNEKYDETMQILNLATDFNQAYTYLEESFEWNMDDVHVQRILELIRRKLIIRKNEQ